MINIVGKLTSKIAALLHYVRFCISYKAGQTYRFTFVLPTYKTVEIWLVLPSVLLTTVSKFETRRWLCFLKQPLLYAVDFIFLCQKCNNMQETYK